MVDSIVHQHTLQQKEATDSTRNVRGEIQTQTKIQRSNKGNVNITECEPTGKFIKLENIHRTKVGSYRNL